MDIWLCQGGIVVIADNDSFAAERIGRRKLFAELDTTVAAELIMHVALRDIGDLRMSCAERIEGCVEYGFTKVHELGPVTSLHKRYISVHCLSYWTDCMIVPWHYPCWRSLENHQL